MPLVTGTLTDFGLQPLTGAQPELIFTPQEPATKNGRLLATRPIVVTPQPSGYFEVDLISTVGVVPATWYEVTIRWVDPASGFDHVRWRLTVPDGGGQIGTLLAAPAGPGTFYAGRERPPVDGKIWLDTSGTDHIRLKLYVN